MHPYAIFRSCGFPHSGVLICIILGMRLGQFIYTFIGLLGS